MTASVPQEISLNDIGRKYMSALQRLSDLIRLSFQVVQQEAERWWLHHSVNEVLGLTSIFIDDIRKLCSLIEFNAARANASGDLATLAAEVNAGAVRGDLPSRLRNLKTRYNLLSPVETELLSLAAFGGCLFRGGIVPKESVLKLQLKCVQASGQSGPQARLTDLQRAWGSDETLALTREQHAAIFTTVSVFFGAMLASVQDFAKLSGLPDTPPGP